MRVLRRVRVAAAVVVAAMAVAAGCGGSTSSTAAPATADGLAETARAAVSTFLSGDIAAGYDYVDKACRDRKTRSEFVVETTVGLEMAKAFGLDLANAEVGDVQTRDVTDSSGQVQVVVEVDGEAMSEDANWTEWVYEEGGWRTTDCGDDDSDSSSDLSSDDLSSTATTVGGELRPSGEAQAEKELNAATTASIGQAVELGDGVTVTVTSIGIGQAYGDSALAVGIRVENRGEDTSNPNVGIRCAGSTDNGIASSSGSTYETMANLPSGSFAEGLVNVIPTSDTTCSLPAYVYVAPFFSMSDTAVKVPIDDALVTQLNAG